MGDLPWQEVSDFSFVVAFLPMGKFSLSFHNQIFHDQIKIVFQATLLCALCRPASSAAGGCRPIAALKDTFPCPRRLLRCASVTCFTVTKTDFHYIVLHLPSYRFLNLSSHE